ncbi:hypothetical protein L226DRAFT_294584 [Lentinus tigrinus ALCF2SS1-7]|uniref:uncharacterized protein n=1 Tax=Lentinus tigrinus ALCF2SS1-7 TaxID=1328758 RepID=UPI001166005B|nr:hypothetical protein L226DRAFT_294584 [Lentinus tigrinus ALCF2SS1-7]
MDGPRASGDATSFHTKTLVTLNRSIPMQRTNHQLHLRFLTRMICSIDIKSDYVEPSCIALHDRAQEDPSPPPRATYLENASCTAYRSAIVKSPMVQVHGAEEKQRGLDAAARENCDGPTILCVSGCDDRRYENIAKFCGSGKRWTVCCHLCVPARTYALWLDSR